MFMIILGKSHYLVWNGMHYTVNQRTLYACHHPTSMKEFCFLYATELLVWFCE